MNQIHIDSIQTWLVNNKDNWSPHNPMATMMPGWCIRMKDDEEKHMHFAVMGMS
jgi:hypothetical protein